MKSETNVCTVCFKLLIDNSKWEVIDSTIKQMLDFLSYTPSIEVDLQSFVCDSCITLLESVYNFKTSCSIWNNIKTENSNNLCRFCRKLVDESTSCRIQGMQDSRILDILGNYLSDLDIKPFEEFIICEKCKESLDNLSKFADISLRSNEFMEDHVIPSSQEPAKYEETDVIEIIDHSIEDLTETKNCAIISEGSIKEHYKKKRIKPLKICEICSFATRSLYSHKIIHMDPSQLQMFRCPECDFETKRAATLKQHLLIHQPVDESKLLKCLDCSFQTMVKQSLRRHIRWMHEITEETMSRCTICDFKTKRPDHLRKHIKFKHSDSSELKMFECEHCPYKCRLSNNLRKHLLSHQKDNDQKLRKCELCNYRTRFRIHLKRHMKFHETCDIKGTDNHNEKNLGKTKETPSSTKVELN